MAKKSKSQKKWSLRQFAPAGLWLCGLAVLSAGFALVVKVLIYIGLFTIPDPKPINLWLAISVGLAVVGPALYALLDPRKVRDFLTGRQARHGSNAVIMLIAFVLIFVVINLIVYQNPTEWDWTEDKQNSLAPETIDTLLALPAPVHAIGFYTSRSSNTSTQELFDNLKTKSNGKFNYEFIDPESDPVKAQQYEITRDGTVVLLMQDRQETLTYVSEQELTRALILLMNPGQRSVYFLTGHGERDIENSGDSSYTRVRSVLESKNYTVRTLNLSTQHQIPEDALAIIVAGPTQPITSDEISVLKSYMTDGGSLVVLEESPILTGLDITSDPLVNYLASDWGITLNNDLVIDTNSSQYVVAISDSYGSHPITEKVQNIISFFPTARSMTIDPTAQNVELTELVKTSDAAWGETDFAALQNDQISFDANSDFAGPLTLAVAAQTTDANSRVVVIGDSDFADDTSFDNYANGDILVNAIDWAAEQDNMISLTAKQPVTRQMLPISNFSMLLLAFSFACLIPGLIIAGGVASWLVRRSRG